ATVAGADPAPGPAAARRLPTAAQAVADRGPGNRPGSEGGRPLSPGRAAEPARARRAPPPGGDEDDGGDRRDDVPGRKHDQASPEQHLSQARGDPPGRGGPARAAAPAALTTGLARAYPGGPRPAQGRVPGCDPESRTGRRNRPRCRAGPSPLDLC